MPRRSSIQGERLPLSLNQTIVDFFGLLAEDAALAKRYVMPYSVGDPPPPPEREPPHGLTPRTPPGMGLPRPDPPGRQRPASPGPLRSPMYAPNSSRAEFWPQPPSPFGPTVHRQATPPKPRVNRFHIPEKEHPHSPLPRPLMTDPGKPLVCSETFKMECLNLRNDLQLVIDDLMANMK